MRRWCCRGIRWKCCVSGFSCIWITETTIEWALTAAFSFFSLHFFNECELVCWLSTSHLQLCPRSGFWSVPGMFPVLCLPSSSWWYRICFIILSMANQCVHSTRALLCIRYLPPAWKLILRRILFLLMPIHLTPSTDAFSVSELFNTYITTRFGSALSEGVYLRSNGGKLPCFSIP